MNPNLIQWSQQRYMLRDVWLSEVPRINEELFLVVQPCIQPTEQFRRMRDQFDSVLFATSALASSYGRVGHRGLAWQVV